MSTPSFERLLTEIQTVDPQLAATTRRLEESWRSGEPRDEQLTELVASMLLDAIGAGLFTLPTMVQGFNTFAHDFMERQIEFLRSGTYRAKNYDEVSRDVYLNETFMCTVYYPALLLSYVASPNYRQILRELDRTLTSWGTGATNRVLDVASGHSFLLLFALSRLPRTQGVGTDIAQAAGKFAPALNALTGWAPGRFSFAVADFLEGKDPLLAEPFDAAICCELLEHVPNPALFLRAIRRSLRPGGQLFLSAAVRMESVDHLTLFQTTDEVAALVAAEGFEVVEEVSVPFVTRRPKDESQRQKLLTSPTVAATFIATCRRRE